MTQTGISEAPLKETPKDAAASVVAQHAATLKALPFSDTGRLRRAGFNACVDTIAMIRHQLDSYRDAGLLPR